MSRCRDQKLLDLAFAGEAEILVSGDRGLRVLGEEAPFAIESPARFRERLEILSRG